MSGPRRATLTVAPVPEFGPGVVRYRLDCPTETTDVYEVPGGLVLEPAVIAAVAIAEHAQRCQTCDMAREFWRIRALDDMEQRISGRLN